MKLIFLNLFMMAACISCATSRVADPQTGKQAAIRTGADQTEKYVPYLAGKRVGVLANPTTRIGDKHLVDSLLARGIKIVKVFGPEHGFRGDADAGASVSDAVDAKTGVPVISLYGKKSKPSKEDLADVDIMIFDVQDVGTRFYTYINVMGRIMEACAENNKELLILDRPNPNGYLVDGPVLDMRLKSGIGAYPIPIAHGLTIAELAQMINGEGWLPGKMKARIKIIPVADYTHDMPYTLPVAPSPNLNTRQSILLYPSLCLFEGTIISQGRGTYYPFTVLGAPALKGKYDFSFTPVGIKGMSATPLHKDQACYGLDLREYDMTELIRKRQINIRWMIDLYKAYPNPSKFFDRTQSNQMGDIDKLAGVYDFKKQITGGNTEAEIRKSWEPGLQAYKKMRKQYLLYP
ncbi:exo-beta-N-acetylmuramidase NamZ family protein [Niabella hirudinis]|uniref:exo-beta-N-acetylmuramidase NamZ family protein n=1 Tax=Niabella hirudinis TaxID=1285929 RepID=UPI003EBD1600